MKIRSLVSGASSLLYPFTTVLRPALLLVVGCVGVTLSAQQTAISPAIAQTGSPSQVVRGHVPAAIAQLSAVGRLSGSTPLRLAIGLPLRNREGLATLLQQLSDPKSPNYRHYLSPEEFTAMFGPSEGDYQAVIDFAKAQGLAVTMTHPNRLLVDVSAPAADIEKALHVKFNTYHHPKEARDFYAPDGEPSLDLTVPVLHISGLDTYSIPHPASLHTKPIDVNAPLQPNAGTGTGPGGAFIGTDFRTAYVPGTALTGAGQTVGLLEFDGYYAADIAKYVQKAGLAAVPLQNVFIGGFSGAPGSANGEVALDIEVVIAMAPQVSKIIVYQAPNPSPFVDLLSRMAFDSNVKQHSCSWGGGGPDPSADQIFQQMAAQGQSFFAASGDSDAYTGEIPFPSDNPFITVVGGTTLTTGSKGAYGSEVVWNWGGGAGSGGGISTFYPIPTWQEGVDMSFNGGSSTLRNIPDVALTADNVFIYADNGAGQSVGGTSAAAPLWAGFTALVNQQATAGCGSSVGFLNPAIYGVGKDASYTNLMNDIVKGDNFSPGSPSKFSAKEGYDLCTGWGSPTVSLISGLAGPGSLALLPAIDPLSGSALLSGDSQPVFVSLPGITNATVIGIVPGGTNLIFANDGQPPDVASNDFVYSAVLHVPTSLNSFPVTIITSAPDHPPVTNTLSYSVVPSPVNDNFVSAIKAPVGGAAYVSNNRYATTEVGEPSHDNDASMAGSLWWAWTPATSTSVLIDTVGSKVDTVLAVYTGSSLTALQPIASASGDITQLRPANVTFNAQAGQTYRIALASAGTNSLGSLKLAILPGGKPDTAPPVITVTGPQSGLTVSNSTVTVTGTASDAAPNISGLNKVLVIVNGCASSPANGTTNWSATVTLQPELNTIQAVAYDEAGNASAPVTIQLVYFVINSANDLFANAAPLTVTSGTTEVDTSNATKETGEPQHAGNSGGKSVWWLFTAPQDGVLSLSTAGSTFDTVLALYTGSTVSELTPVASNDDAFPGAPGGYSLIEQAIHSNVTYAIAVDGYNGASGTNDLTWSFTPTNFVHLTATAVGSGSVQIATINSLGGRSIQPSSSVDLAQDSTLLLTATPSSHARFDSWGGDVLSIRNPVTFSIQSNMTVVAHFLPVIFSDDFESGNFQHLPWSTAGNAPWVIESTNVAAGNFAARSGAIGNNQTSSLLLTANLIDGNGAFDYRVSSELNFDFLEFFIDGNLIQKWSGEAGWTTFTFPVTSGTHTLEWRYAKDPGNRAGLDAAFIDDVSLPIAVPKDSTTPAKLTWVMGTDNSFFINVLGQTNQFYIMETSADLIHWQQIFTAPAQNGFLRFDPGEFSNSVQFYRAVVP